MAHPDLIVANSPAFEYVYVANQRCACGGHFAVVCQELRAGPVDRLTGRCELCGEETAFDFDIGSFFGQFEKYSRFHQTDDRFREAMAHIHAGRWGEAEAALQQAVDEEEGEPAFAWGHYHLGMVLLHQGHSEQALTHLQRAAALQPLEADIHEGLGRAFEAAGRQAEAQESFQRAEGLRIRFDQ